MIPDNVENLPRFACFVFDDDEGDYVIEGGQVFATRQEAIECALQVMGEAEDDWLKLNRREPIPRYFVARLEDIEEVILPPIDDDTA
jgi:hypothetical protein